MSNNMFGNMPGLQSFEEFYSGGQFYQDDLSGLENSWMDNLDPELRQNQQQAPPAWQLQHQFQQQNRLQQPTMERFIQEPERHFFSAAPLSTQPQGFFGMNRSGAPISTLPRVSQNRMGSPSPSQGGLTSSTCCSALSPPAETDWSQDNIFSPQLRHEELQQSMAQYHSHPDQWFEHFQCPGSQSMDPTVQLSQIQAFSDMPPEVSFDGDEGYDEMTLKTEYSSEIDNRMFKTESGQSSYRYPSDEGLGASIKDGGSPQNSTIHVDHEVLSDADADADGDIDGDIIVAEEDQDDEYTPRSTRTRKRAAPSTKPSTPNKRSRHSKSVSKAAKGQQHQCKTCEHAPFKDAAALQRHNASTHTRAFICVFAFAGCPSTFASKNEWKRHVSSQHLNLSAWVCELQSCSKVLSSSPKSSHSHSHSPSNTSNQQIKGSEFNRKDLFIQHLRRMHAPFAVKRLQKKNPEWEERLKNLALSCLKVKRQAPTHLRCPVVACGAVFEGSSCWDDRMEHVGKHLEKAAAGTGTGTGEEVRQENDGLLVQWAVREGIVESRGGNGGYRLCGAGGRVVDDEDAEGDEE